MRRLHYFVATSLDGFIASPSGGWDAFPLEGEHIDAQVRELPETLPAHVLQALGLETHGATFDTVLMGWNTFAVGGLPSPYSHLRQYVWSRERKEVGADVTLTAEAPVDVVRRLKAEDAGRDIWLCGGGRLASVLFDEIDRITFKVNPVVLGAGIRAFETPAYDPRRFVLANTRSFATGVVWNTYERAVDAR